MATRMETIEVKRLMSSPSQDRSDAELLSAFAVQGDREAMAEVFLRYKDPAYRLALSLCGSGSDAEEAVQNAFVEIIRSAGRYRGTPSAKGWIMGIVVNVGRGRMRSEARLHRRELESAAQTRAANVGEGGPALLEAVLKEVNRLPEDARIPVWLHYIEQLTYSEVGEVLSISGEAARKRASQGLDELQDVLADAGFQMEAAVLVSTLSAAALPSAPAQLGAMLSSLAHNPLAAAPAAPVSAASGAFGLKVAAFVAMAALAGGGVFIALRQETGTPGEKNSADAAAGGEIKGDAKAPPASGKPLLGAADYMPAPEAPLGWRGDWSGRYPGATPPLEWNRWPKGAFNTIRTQSEKPKPGDEHNASLVEIGFLRDWLVLGPFTTANSDPKKMCDETFLPNEADAAPASGEPAAGASWKAVHPLATQANYDGGGTLCVKLDKIFGPLKNQIAYLHTYLYSESAQRVILWKSGARESMRVWLNGKPITPDKHSNWRATGMEIDLAAGWNRMLVKSVHGDKGEWSEHAHLAPLTNTPYESKNIAWMTGLPSNSCSLPVVVGNKIFVSSGQSDLICVNKADGKIQWMHTFGMLDAFSDEDRKAMPDIVSQVPPLAEKLKAQNADLVALYNAAVSPVGIAPEARAAIDRSVTQKRDLEGKIWDLVQKSYPKEKWRGRGQPYGNGTPSTDGKYIYQQWANGLVTACDQEGSLKWSAFEDPQGIGEHGLQSSCYPVGDLLLISSERHLIGLDKATGARRWFLKAENFAFTLGVPTKIGGVDVLLDASARIVRVSDGKLIAGTMGGTTPWVAPVVSEGWFYTLNTLGSAQAYKLPAEFSETPQIEKRKPVEFKTDGYTTSSVLYHDGLVYVLDGYGKLFVVDHAAGKLAYEKQLDFHPRVCWVFKPGICASPTLAGKYIYLMDNSGVTIVIEPGRTYKQVARNVVANYIDENLEQDQSLSTPIFDGNSLIYRGQEYLYCIREK